MPTFGRPAGSRAAADGRARDSVSRVGAVLPVGAVRAAPHADGSRLALGCLYLGLAPRTELYVPEKIQHFIAFFLLTLVFYWILDLTRRRALQLTVVVCTVLGGIGSEFLQGLLPVCVCARMRG